MDGGCLAGRMRAGSGGCALSPGVREGLSTPREDGFAMVPDWAPHARCWMAWPCREAPWGGGLDEARRTYAEVAQAIARFEPVTMIARPELVAMASLYCGPGITTLALPHDDGWVRDVGPCFLRATLPARLAGATWAFNGWGELHTDYAQDADLARRLLEHVGARRYASSMVLEAGAIQVDGEGTCIAGIGPVLDPKRNPGLTLAEAECGADAPAGRGQGDLAAGGPGRRRGRRPCRQCRHLRPAGPGPGAGDRRPRRPGLWRARRESRRPARVGRRARPHPRGGDRAAAEGAAAARWPAPAACPTSTAIWRTAP